jgi:predicted ATPase
LLSRLEQRLPLLTAGGRDLPARQQTMRAAIAWSHDLLQAEEQQVFRRLSVFAGGCTFEAAEAVAGEDGLRDILPSLAALVDISLMRQVEDRPGEPRFRMLETVREFGLEQLALAGELDDARRRHAAHFLRRAGSLAVRTPRVVNLETMSVFAADLDNLRLALGWFDERDDTEAMLQVCWAL